MVTINRILKSIEEVGDDLRSIALSLHREPETGMNERASSALLAAKLADFGFTVEKPFAGLDTAFKATFGEGRTSFCFIAEYDALPEMGHACGHNLIAVSALAAGKAMADALRSDGLDATVVVMGTPAEEARGGKVMMIEAGAFDGIDAAVMAHPLDVTATWGGSLGVVRPLVRFIGEPAHAAAAPEEGRNALDAVNLLFAGVSAWRQQLPDGVRVHGVITNGGTAPNIIPALTEASFYLRAEDEATLDMMRERFAKIAEGAALMTATAVEVSESAPPYRCGKPDARLNELFWKAASELGMNPSRSDGVWQASTDFGDVSQILPGTHVSFDIFENEADKAALHTREFAEAAKSERAISQALKVGAALAKVGCDYVGGGEKSANA